VIVEQDSRTPCLCGLTQRQYVDKDKASVRYSIMDSSSVTGSFEGMRKLMAARSSVWKSQLPAPCWDSAKSIWLKSRSRARPWRQAVQRHAPTQKSNKIDDGYIRLNR